MAAWQKVNLRALMRLHESTSTSLEDETVHVVLDISSSPSPDLMTCGHWTSPCGYHRHNHSPWRNSAVRNAPKLGHLKICAVSGTSTSIFCDRQPIGNLPPTSDDDKVRGSNGYLLDTVLIYTLHASTSGRMASSIIQGSGSFYGNKLSGRSCEEIQSYWLNGLAMSCKEMSTDSDI